MYNPATDDTPELLPQVVWRRDPNADPMQFFPFKTARPQQEMAIRKAIEAYKSGKKIVVLEGPCGSGKSGIIMTLANYFGTAHILTPLKALQTQYLTDFPNIADSRGKSNYTCEYDLARIKKQETIEGIKLFPKTCANAPCTKKGFSKPGSCDPNMSIIQDQIVSFDDKTTINALTGEVLKFTGCPYQVAKLIAGQTPIICHNFDSFLYQNLNIKGGFLKRPFLAVDECHNFEGKIINFNGVTVPEELMMPGDNLIDCQNIAQFFDFFCKDKPYSYDDMMKYCDHDQSMFVKRDEIPSRESKYTRSRFFVAAYNYWNSQDDMRKANEFNEIAEKIIRIGVHYQSSLAGGYKCEFEFDLQKRQNGMYLTGHPLFAGVYSHSILNQGDHILLASATVLNHKIYCRSIGINPDETEFIQMESDFPKEKRVIKKQYAGSMSYANKAATMPNMIDKIKDILDAHKDQKGMIHSHTFDITKTLFNELVKDYGDRILTMEMFKEKNRFNAKEAMLEFHAQCPDPTVIIDPACDQGVDLPDDLCRFQCLVKVPYPSLTKWMKARMNQPGGQEWYTLQAALKFVQSYGRGNRHKDDWCVHYLLDSDFDRFINQCKSKGLIPSWITAAIETRTVVFK